MTMAAIKKTHKPEAENPYGKVSLSLGTAESKYAQERADQKFDGKLSRYVRNLIQREMRKQKVAA